jgi:hypothetical protein
MIQRASEDDRYPSCSLFSAESGLAGYRLGTEGGRLGWLYDFFVSPREVPGAQVAALEVAVREGARQLVCYSHPLLLTFYSRFGFRVRAAATLDELDGPPRAWLPPAVEAQGASLAPPSFLFMARPENPSDLPQSSEVRSGEVMPGLVVSMADTCFACGAGIRGVVHWLGVLEGYVCTRCQAVQVCGRLTLGPWDRRE